MSIKTKVIVTTFIVAVAAFLLGHMIWAPVGPMPGPDLMPFFVVENFMEALSFGIGMSFLIYGWPTFKKLPLSTNLQNWTFAAIGWLLVSWWPHGNLHISNGENFPRLLFIEYGFHVTLVVSAVVVAYAVLKVAKKQ